MNRHWLKKIGIEVCIIFLLSLTPLLWFRSGTLMLGHDNVFPLEPKEFLLGRLTTWVDHAFGQNQSLILGTIPIHFIDALPYLFGFSVFTSQKIVYVFWFFMMGLAMYTLMKTLRKDGWFAVVASILYQFNFFILQGWWIGEKSKFSAYIALPLVVSVLVKVYRKELSVLKGIAVNSLILFFFNGAGLYGVPLFGGLFISVGVFVFLFGKNIRVPLLVAGTFVGSFIINSYFWLPGVSALVTQYRVGIASQGGVQGLIEWASEISANSSFVNLMRLQGIAEWYDNPEHPFAKYFLTNPWLIVASFVWPFLVLLSMRRQKDKEQERLTVYFLFVYLLGLFFAAGTHEPFGFLYVFLVKTIPGFGIFRTPYFKFAPAIYLAVSFLATSAVERLPTKVRRLGFVFVSLFVLVYHFPYFSGNFFEWRKGFSTRLTVPSYVFDFGKWLNYEKKDDFRVLMLPPNNPDLRYSMYMWGYLSFQSIATLVSNQPVVINNDRLNDEEKTLVLTLYQAIASRNKPLFMNLINTLRIGYLVVQHDTVRDKNIDLPLEPETYQKVLEEDFQLAPLRSFGSWTLYATDKNSLGRMVVARSVSTLDSLGSDVWKYYTFSKNPFFARRDDLPSQIDFAQDGKYIIADCINCKAKERPFIKFPERNILPGSPFYPFLLWNENRRLHTGDPKSLIYDYLGISLKRISEIRELIKDNKPVGTAVHRRFTDLMDALAESFEKLEKYEDKIDVADDIQFYLESERNILTELLGIYVISGDQVNALGQVTQAISSAISAIEQYVLIPNEMTHRLYQLELDVPTPLSMNVYTGDFHSIQGDSILLSLSIDQKSIADNSISLTKEPSWVQLGTRTLEAGTHYLMLTYPQTANSVPELLSSTTEFNRGSDIGCFTANVEDFDYKKIYRVKAAYLNNFTNELFLYIWESVGVTKRLRSVFRLPPSQVKEEFTRLIKTYADTTGIEIGFCARGLTQEIVEKNLALSVNELLYPSLFLVGQSEQVVATVPVEMKKVGRTTYDVSFTATSPNSVLTFFDRFDPGWKLSGFEDKHFRMNGYANGWQIEKPGTYKTKLTFRPQRTYTIGILLSLVSVVVAARILLWNNRKK